MRTTGPRIPRSLLSTLASSVFESHSLSTFADPLSCLPFFPLLWPPATGRRTIRKCEPAAMQPKGAAKIMSNSNSPNQPRNRAVAALNSLLSQVSAITLKEINVGWPVATSENPGREIDILAHVEVFGRSHTLVCQISSGSGQQQVRESIEELQRQTACLPGKITPVLILPVLSPEVQALCDQSKTGWLDLHGNGRLAIDEIFISVRSLPRRAYRQPALTPATASLRTGFPAPAEELAAQRLLRGFPPAPASASGHASRNARHVRPH
jgi:hypothetical protein